MKPEEKLTVIAMVVKEQIKYCDESFNELAHTLEMINNDAETYNNVWCNLSAISTIRHFFLRLQQQLDTKDVKKVENYLRFTVCQIGNFNNKAQLEGNTSTGDIMIDSRVVIYQIFNSYLNQLPA